MYNSVVVTCPLCGIRRARRGCPALGKQICAVCCGTKRLVEIRCPSDCSWLASSREHPPAVVVRQQQRDVAVLVQVTRDFSQQQSRLFFLVSRFLVGYETPHLQPMFPVVPMIDEDITDATTALAASFETESRGVIYEHRPASPAGERLAAALKPVLAEAGKGAGSSFTRDGAVVLRQFARAVRQARDHDRENRRAFLELLDRTVGRFGSSEDDASATRESPRLIVP
jgi:hypothetical protein